MLYATKWGIGVAPDSIMYIGAARNLADGRGFTEPSESGKQIPITHWPPFYPMILAAFGAFGIDPVIGAKAVGIFLFIANIAFVVLMIKRCSGNLFLFPLYGALLMLSSVTMLSLHSMALTESLFIFLGMLGLFLLSVYMEGSNRWFMLSASVAVGLTFLTRYPGIVLVMTGMAGLICLGRKSCQKKAIDALLFGVLSCLPIGLWVIRNKMIAGTATNRSMVYHPISMRHINNLLFTLSGWLLPPSVPNVIRNMVLLLVFAGSIIAGFLILQQQKHMPVKERPRHVPDAKASEVALQQQVPSKKGAQHVPDIKASGAYLPQQRKMVNKESPQHAASATAASIQQQVPGKKHSQHVANTRVARESLHQKKKVTSKEGFTAERSVIDVLTLIHPFIGLLL
ncbi:MAG: glycosyltransferase family 39 protein, partial [Nitrospirae bacterium]|nr:glycosyltransferase family 39 protein [Nitrospirota bacterium]